MNLEIPGGANAPLPPLLCNRCWLTLLYFIYFQSIGIIRNFLPLPYNFSIKFDLVLRKVCILYHNTCTPTWFLKKCFLSWLFQQYLPGFFFIVRFMLAQKEKCAKLATYSGRLSLIFLSGLRLGDLYQAELAFNPCLV